MKKLFMRFTFFLPILFCLTGCSSVGSKNASLSIIYIAAAALSFLILIGCILLVRKKRFWFIMLFSSVFVVNTGYSFLALSSCLDTALWANRLSYLGSVFLPFSMLMIILEVTNTKYNKHLANILFVISIIVFLIAASPGILPIYYKDVTFKIVNGVSVLDKEYGILHPLYLIYLLCYFASMVAVIFRAHSKKTIENTSHSIILAISVFVNLGVWFIEQLTDIDFEFLSVSYIISEMFLLGVHLVVKENQRLRELVKQVEFLQDTPKPDTMLEKPIENKEISAEQIEQFMSGLSQLTPTEKSIYDAYIARVTTKEIMNALNIKESTLKYHNRNIYGKLGVSSRKELNEIYKHIKSVQIKLQ